MSKRAKMVWIESYTCTGVLVKIPEQGTDRDAYSIRKMLVSPPGYYGRLVPRYDVSVSRKRTSWYKDFASFNDARKFALSLVRDPHLGLPTK